MLDNLEIRTAQNIDLENIWIIFEQAIQKRKNEGSSQWQNGYPNPKIIKEDIFNKFGYVVVNTLENKIIGYIAIIEKPESNYKKIYKGNWLNEYKYIVVHRLVVKQDIKIKKIGTWIMAKIEEIALLKNIKNIRIDTKFDNASMLRLLEKFNYTYCGEILINEDKSEVRKAFQKII